MINDIPVACINHAAELYHVPTPIILAVMKNENGKNGLAKRNKNGTYDYGVMQINSIWLPRIAPYGYSKNDIQFNACKNVEVGTWLIAKGITTGKSLWSGVANYHSHTYQYNVAYQNKAYANYRTITAILN